MKSISFSWTKDVLQTGFPHPKTVTRRFWSDAYAKRFHKGDIVAATDRSQRFGGRQIETIQLTRDPYKEPLSKMTDEEELAEGGLWGSAQGFIKAMGGPDKVPWVIRFKVLMKKTCKTCRHYGHGLYRHDICGRHKVIEKRKKLKSLKACRHHEKI